MFRGKLSKGRREKKPPVVHHKHLKLGDIVYNKLLELVGKVVPGLLVRAVSNVGHQGASLELPPDTGVNTLRPAPAWLQKTESAKLGLLTKPAAMAMLYRERDPMKKHVHILFTGYLLMLALEVIYSYP